MKELEGCTVYLVPTGNLARYAKNKEYVKATVVKVVKVNITILLEGRSIENKYRYQANRLSDNSDGGYILFSTEDEVNDHYELIKIKKHLASYYDPFANLNINEMRQIQDIINNSKNR